MGQKEDSKDGSITSTGEDNHNNNIRIRGDGLMMMSSSSSSFHSPASSLSSSNKYSHKNKNEDDPRSSRPPPFEFVAECVRQLHLGQHRAKQEQQQNHSQQHQ